MDPATRRDATREANEDTGERMGPGLPPEHVVNEHITLRLEGGKTYVYVGGERFKQCMFLFADIDLERVRDYDEIGSIDELSDGTILQIEESFKSAGIAPEDVFWGHCSNLQAWAEHGYDTRLLHSNLAFPLLKRLAELGDAGARRVFKGEIVKRLASGYEPTIGYLKGGGYLKYLDATDVRGLFADVANTPGNETAIKNLFHLGIFDRLHLAETMAFSEGWAREKNLYPGVSREEAAVLAWLELHAGKPIPEIESFHTETTGFTAAGGHVTELACHPDGMMKCLPKEIGNFTTLTALSVRRNSLACLPGEIGDLKSLRTPNNELTSIPDSIGRLANLESLALGWNDLCSIPDTIGNLRSLKTLSLSYNHLASLPDSIGRLVSLNEFWATDNELASLPDTIGNLRSLKEFFISANKLTSLPEAIGQLSSLEILSLSYNHLDALPDTIGQLTSLKYLFLDGNKLTSLPDSIVRLTGLEKLHLHGNELASLPESVEAWIKDLRGKWCEVRR